MAINRNEIGTKILLSICIPTFNRVDKTLNLVKSLLKSNEDNIEIIVLDNCSTDNTQYFLSKIKDQRFIYSRNDFNIGSMPNLLKSLSIGTGEFVMLCLDKDFIISENIPYLIERICLDKDVVVGQCVLNSHVFDKDTVYEKGVSSLLNLAYTSEHPSGLFVNRNILKETLIIERITNNNSVFAFNTELLKAELSVLGKSKRINIPLICTESLEDCEKEISHTYKANNIYFFPKNILNTFNVYCENLFNLKILNKDKIVILKNIFFKLLLASTFGYKSIMVNKSICSHHGIQTYDVTLKELIKYAFRFTINFIKSDIPISSFYKIYISTVINFKIVYMIILNKYKK